MKQVWKEITTLVRILAEIIYDQFGDDHPRPQGVTLEGAEVLALEAVTRWRKVASELSREP